MSNLKTLLIILVAIFLVGAVGAEVYYLFFYQPRPATPNLPPIVVLPTSAIPQGKINQIRWLAIVATGSAMASSIRTDQYEGALIGIDTKGGVEKELANFQYKLGLWIRGKGNDVVPFFFTESEVNRITVIQKKGGKESPIRISDLKKGDSIIVTLRLDFKTSKTDNLIKGTIVKIIKSSKNP